MASYPSAIKTFTNKVDGVNIVHAADVNEPYAEITAIETELGTLPKGAKADVKTRLNDVDTAITGAVSRLDGHDTDITTLDGRVDGHDTQIALLNEFLVGGRITLESNVPVSIVDQTAKTTVYYTPFIGNRIGLYTGSAWVVCAVAELSLSLSGYTANKNYDIFVNYNSGTPALASLVWTNDSTRGTALTRQDGVLVLTGTTTYRYVGTIRITGTTGQCEDSKLKRFVWNQYNRTSRELFRFVNAAHTYNSATYRQFNADNTQIVEWVSGEQGTVAGSFSVSMSNDTGTSIRLVLCIDDVAAATGATFRELGACGWNTAAENSFNSASGWTTYAAGYHYLNAEEASSVTGTNSFSVLYIRGRVEG